MKLAVITGNGGSGGLMAYLKGFLSVKTDLEINFYCSKSFKIDSVAENINIIRNDYSAESGKEIFFNKPLNNELIKMIDEFNPDIVMYANGWIRKGLEKYPNIMILHNQLCAENMNIIRMIKFKDIISFMGFKVIMKRSLKKTDGVIFLSNNSKYSIEKKGIKIKNQKVVRFGIDNNFLIDNFAVKTKKEKIKILYVSSFFKYKNHEKLLKAIKIVKKNGYNVELYLVGGLNNLRKKHLEKKIIKYHMRDNVIFTGWKSHDEVMKYMDESDVFVYPSLVESTGLGVMEAMARGMCIASSNISCMPEVLKDAGVYFNPYKSVDIAKSIIKIINDDDLREKKSALAYEYSKEYTWEKCVEETISFFYEVENNKLQG